MADVVFILGAGASAHAGVPVMDKFIDEASVLLKKHEVTDPDKIHFDKIFKVRESLRRLYSNFSLVPGFNNIETIYGMIEMGNLIKIFPDIKDEDEIFALKTSINKFIVRTIEERTHFELSQNEKVLAPSVYRDFIRLISRLEYAAPHISSSILTFNYDIALDFVMQRELGVDKTNYCLESKDHNRGYKLLKLHGSINWGLCNNNKCKSINPILPDKRITQRMFDSGDRAFRFKIPISQSFKKTPCTNCEGGRLSDLPLIIPPTWNKTEYHSTLSRVWRIAAEEISGAEIIIFIGYSLPESDLFFKYLLSIGGINLNGLKDFIVIDRNLSVLDKFYEMLGPEIKSKFNKEYTIKELDFRSSLKFIEQLLRENYRI